MDTKLGNCLNLRSETKNRLSGGASHCIWIAGSKNWGEPTFGSSHHLPWSLMKPEIGIRLSMNPKIPNLSWTRAEPVHVRPCHGPCGQSDARSHRWSPYRRRWHARRWECQCRVQWHPGDHGDQLKQVNKKNSAEAFVQVAQGGSLFWESQKVPNLKVSMDWFKGKFTGKPHISWENLWFPVDFPLNQSIESWQWVVSSYYWCYSTPPFLSACFCEHLWQPSIETRRCEIVPKSSSETPESQALQLWYPLVI